MMIDMMMARFSSTPSDGSANDVDNHDDDDDEAVE